MEDKIEEGLIKGSIDIISIDKINIILEQMKKCICKIYGKKNGTGFFCKIKYNNELMPVLFYKKYGMCLKIQNYSNDKLSYNRRKLYYK